MSIIDRLVYSTSLGAMLQRRLRRLYHAIRPPAYRTSIEFGEVERPHYGMCLLDAAETASRLGLKALTAIEFGVAGGNGLIALEGHAARVSEIYNIDVQIYGFDIATGLPESSDYRDMVYNWAPGSFQMDQAALQRRLQRTKLIIGDVKSTAGVFYQTYDPAPVGCIFFDLDFYSSTKAAFEIFEGNERYFLPRVQCYFDDVNLTNEFLGELCAISEFNAEHADKKIRRRYNFGTRLYEKWSPWLMYGNRMFEYHHFKHSRYNDQLGSVQQRPLYENQ